VQEELVAMIVAGNDATPGQFDGILNTTGIQTQAWSADMLETLRKAITKVRNPGKARATGIAMNPVDWESIELMKTGNDNYMFGGPQNVATPRIWSVPVTLVDDMPVGTAVVGDWRYAVLWDRESATVTLYDQNEDDAIKNMVTILGELRAGFSVLRPPAFVNVDLTAA
jgi:HK97 family phage major capsid protein